MNAVGLRTGGISALGSATAEAEAVNDECGFLYFCAWWGHALRRMEMEMFRCYEMAVCGVIGVLRR